MNRLSNSCLLLLALILIIPSTSLADPRDYLHFCDNASKNHQLFSNFKRDPFYRPVVENVSYEQGLLYLKIITSDYPDLVKHFDTFRRNDTLGNPVTYDYSPYGFFSPTTLRYIKIAGDLRKEFGELSQLNILEIGGGYGGLCTIISYLSGYQSYTIIDQPESKALAKKNLQFHGIFDVQFYSDFPLPEKNYDLVISNFSFSEYGKEKQMAFMDQLFSQASNGYLTCNYISKDSLSSTEFLSLLMQAGKSGKVETEQPLTAPTNLLFKWKTRRNPLVSPFEKGVDRFLTPSYSSYQPRDALTYAFSLGGRLGDNLIAFLHAKWISYKYGIPLLYNPFQYGDLLALSNLHQHQGNEFIFRTLVYIDDENEIPSSSLPQGTLWVVPYFAEAKSDRGMFDLGPEPDFDVDWDDPLFHEEVIRSLTPKTPLKKFNFPADCKTVAVHVRRGGGFDASDINRAFVEKFPPDSFFIQQIQRVADLYRDQKLFVHIFTDDPHPKVIADDYRQVISNPNIVFSYRTEMNTHHSNVLEDLFAMSEFDCLIGGASNFSIVASIIGQHKIEIRASKGHWEGNTQIIDQVELTFRQ